MMVGGDEQGDEFGGEIGVMSAHAMQRRVGVAEINILGGESVGGEVNLKFRSEGGIELTLDFFSVQGYTFSQCKLCRALVPRQPMVDDIELTRYVPHRRHRGVQIDSQRAIMGPPSIGTKLIFSSKLVEHTHAANSKQ